MRKQSTCNVLMVGLLFCGIANAENINFPKVYLGADALYTVLKRGELKDSSDKPLIRKGKPGVDLYIGARITDYMGVEAGYAILKGSRVSSTALNGTAIVKIYNPHVDAMAYLPLLPEIDLMASLGFGHIKSKLSVKMNDGKKAALSNEWKNLSKSRTGIRAGFGAQYILDNQFGARLMLRHQRGNKIIKNINSVAAGLFYQF